MATKKQLQQQIDVLTQEIKEIRQQLAPAPLEVEVQDREHPYYGYMHYDPYARRAVVNRPTKTVHELTLAGQVQAIVDHLGIDIEVEQKKTITTGPKVKVVKKTMKKITKKGKK